MKIINIGYDKLMDKKIYKLKFDAKEIPKMQLFNSEDVIVGNPNSNIAIGFIYTWKEDKAPDEIRNFFNRVSNYAYITGFWKTTNGARYVFSNILANPNVNKLLLFVFDCKDNGHLLVDALINFWKNGVDDNGIIIGSKAPNPRFEQVPPDAIKRIRKQSDLVVLRNIRDLSDAEKVVKMLFQEPENAFNIPDDVEFYSNYIDKKVINRSMKIGKLYDDGARFKEPYVLDLSKSAKKVEFIEKYSGLPLGQTVYADNLEDALEMITAFVYKKGQMFRDQRGVITMESRSFNVTIKNPLEKIPKGFSEEYISKYTKEFMHGETSMKGAKEFAYTYHERIFKKWGNQVKRAINVLKQNKYTRRCMISLWDPKEDLESQSPPCLNFIWLVIRNNLLEIHIVYRSHHLSTITKEGKLMEGEGAFVPNLYALGTLQEYIAKELKIKKGPLALTDFSAHLYMSNV